MCLCKRKRATLRRGGEGSGRKPREIDEARKGELSGDGESIEPARGMKSRCSTKPSETLRRGRESNPRIAVLQTATLPLGYPAELRERTISLWRRLYQAQRIQRQAFVKPTTAAHGQRFNASTLPILLRP